MKIERISGVILAGGKNLRFPFLKGFIKLGKSTIIEKNLSLLKELFDEVFISANIPDVYFYLGAPIIGDVLPSLGPMSGIYSALINTKSECAFVIACDMPFAKDDLILFICKKHDEISRSKSVDATIPIYNGEPQPLFGVYCKKVLPYFECCVLNDKTSMRRLLNEINVYFIDESDIMTIDPDGRSFVNINTIEDYVSATGNSAIERQFEIRK